MLAPQRYDEGSERSQAYERRVEGEVYPNGLKTKYWFEYGEKSQPGLKKTVSGSWQLKSVVRRARDGELAGTV